MKNIVYVIAIIFWILSMISKSRKKQQQTAERQRAQNLSKRFVKRQETAPKAAARFSDDVVGVFQKPIPEPVTDYESAYASSDYTEALVERTSVRSEGLKSLAPKEDNVSHYRKNYGMASSLGTESSEEKEAYDKEKKVIPKFTFGDSAIKQYIIASEILGKPKALRR
jgi:hypothetical protein